jgi:hypothetical protein
MKIKIHKMNEMDFLKDDTFMVFFSIEHKSMRTHLSIRASDGSIWQCWLKSCRRVTVYDENETPVKLYRCEYERY